MKKISIIIPVYNEEAYIDDCVKSVISFDYPKEYLEVIFVDGNSSDKTVEIIQKYQIEYNYIKIINNPKKIVPISMNMGISASTGEYICRLDAHAEYPENYLSSLVYWSQTLNADNVGAVCNTGIKNDTNISKAIQFVMSDKFGVGNSLFRVGVKEPVEVDTVPFGFYKKEVFDNVGLYDERLIRTQDLELNKRLKKSGGKIFLVPEITCTYYPRETMQSFFKNRFQTGRWVILSPYFTNSLKSISVRHMVPLIFTFTLIVSFLLSFTNDIFYYIFFFILSFYSVVLFARAFFLKKNFLLSFHILLAYFNLHFSYGFGSLKAIYEVLVGKMK